MEKNKKIKYLIFVLISILSLHISFASLQLNLIQFDPAIITAGDEVDVIVQFRDNTSTFITQKKLGNSNYKFKVTLNTDDDVSKKYIRILDSIGNNINGATLYTNQVYNKKFRIKVSPNAATGNYQFKLIGKWYKNGIAEDISQDIRFLMNVKKEGILLNIASIQSVPSQIRPGNNFVELKTFVENLGFKDSKNIKISLELPNGISNSYSNNNELEIGRLNAGVTRNISFFLDINKLISSGVYNINYSLNYMDLDNNKYFKKNSISLLIKPKANLKIIKTIGEGLAGDNGKLKIWVKNIGEQSAENIEVRILKQNSQPFSFDVRSDYIGTLKPNETGLVIFNFKILSNAQLKSHNFQIILRSKGDSENADNNIYTYNREANFKVIGVAKNYYLYYGSLLMGLFIIYLVISKIYFRKNKKVKK